MKKTMSPAAEIASLGLMPAFSNAFGQGESQGSSDAKTAAAVPDSAKGSVEVTLTEYKIEMPASVSAGATTFKVTNTGKEAQGFEIEGNGIEKALKPENALRPASWRGVVPAQWRRNAFDTEARRAQRSGGAPVGIPFRPASEMPAQPLPSNPQNSAFLNINFA
jgi:hypothetical protein